MTTIVNISTILMKRGNTTAASNYVGPLGELLLDTGQQTLRLQDGATPGGMTTLVTTQQLSNVIARIEGIQGNVTANVQALLANISGVTQIVANVANLQANSNSLNSGIYSAVLGTNGGFTLPSTLTLPSQITWSSGGSQIYEDSDLVLYSPDHSVDVVAGTHYWNFNNDGSTTLPSYVKFTNNGTQASINGTDSSGGLTIGGDSSQIARIHFPGFNGQYYNHEPVTITLNSSSWQFNNLAGNITLPSGVQLMSGYPGHGYIGDTATLAGAQVYLSSTDGVSWLGVENGLPGISSSADAAWYFQPNGVLSLPYSNYLQTTDVNMTIGSQGKISLISNAAGGSTNYYWNFNADGSTSMPGNVTIIGNLTVNGNTTTINASNLIVSDNIIYFAAGNPANTLDIGTVGHFNNGTYQHTGLVRQATTGQWKLFSNITAEPTNTIDFTYAVYDPIQVGAITSPTIVDLYANAATQAGNITTLFSNAASQATDITALYSNAATQATSLNTLNANIGAFEIYANANASTQATSLNTINANVGSFYTWANTNFGTSNYSNTNVAGYLTSQNITSANIGTLFLGNVATQANIGSFYTFSNANAATQATSINTINANIGAYFTWANTNFGTSSYSNTNVAAYLTSQNITSANIGTLFLGNASTNANLGAYQNTTNANIGAFYTYANTAISNLFTNANANTAAYLTLGVTGNIKTSANIVAPNYLFANGVNILSTVGASSYGNTQVAAYIPTDPTIATLQANIGSFYTYANATYTGGGSTYSNANVVAMLAANTAVFIGPTGVIGNVATGNIQANATALFLGANTVISNYGSPTFGYATHIGNNIYFDANGVQRYRNTQTGASDLIVGPGSLSWYAAGGAVTANAATGYTGGTGIYMGLSTSSMSLYQGIGLVSSGAVTIQSSTGLVTNQATIAVFNGVGTTINMGGVATTITLGQSTPGTSSNIFIGNTIGTQTGNLTIRARGQYNYTTAFGVAGGYNAPPYTAQALTGGSGTGMTATYTSVGGYVTFPITIVNPGTGYKNGDVLTLPGGLGSTAQIWNYNSNYIGQTGQSDITFTIDGNLLLPGNLTIPTSAGITAGSVASNNHLFANGVNILTTVTGTYSNANVASYLPTYSGNITASNVNITSNVTAAYHLGDGSKLTNIQANLQSGNIYGTASNVTLVAGSYSSVFDNTGNVTLPGNLKVANTITINNVTVTMATNGYNNWRGNTYANVDNISASVFANGAPAFGSILGTLNYFWSSVTNLTGGKFFGNTSTGGAITTAPTSIGTGITLGSGGDTVIVTLQDQDLKRAYTITYMQTVGSANCAIVTKRIL